MRVGRTDLENTAGFLTKLTGVVYSIDGSNGGYCLETSLQNRTVSPRLKAKQLLEWIQAAIDGAMEAYNNSHQMLTFFNESTSESLSMKAGIWQMLGRGIYCDNVKVAEWDGAYWVIAHNSHRYRCFRMGG